MSALQLVLPRLWATASNDHDTPSLARAAGALAQRQPAHSPGQTFVPGRRKGPHSLRLVQARAAHRGPQAVTEPVAQPIAPPLPAPVAAPVAAPRAQPVRPQPQLAFYRKYTEAMLRRYLKLSLEAGRVPSLIGQDILRGNASHCAVTGFDDVVIFVEDVNKCLARLDAGQRFLVRKIAMEGHTQGEAAAMHGLPLRSVIRRYTEALDRLTRLFLDRRMLQEMGDPELEG